MDALINKGEGADTSDDEEEQHDESMKNKLLLLYLLNELEKGFYYRLNSEGRWRRDRNIPRFALPDPCNSAWQHIYRSGDDGSLITVTGFDYSAFEFMKGLFEPYFNAYSPWTGHCDGLSYKRLNHPANQGKGRKRIIQVEACLGLVLAWYRFRGSEFILQGWFGFTGAHTNVWLRFGRRMLLKALNQLEEAQVMFPDHDMIKAYQEAVKEKHNELGDVYCTADGLKIPFQSCHGLSKQSVCYNGWLHGHFVTNLFVFGADGKIINAVTNAPGSVHDSTLATWGGTYKKLEAVHKETEAVCCVDSAFNVGTAKFLLKSAQDTTKARNKKHKRRLLQATSLRQASEWGMRAVQGSMPRLKDAIHYEENGERRRILKLVPLLYNLRLSRVGLNQIANTYVPHWKKDSQYIIN